MKRLVAWAAMHSSSRWGFGRLAVAAAAIIAGGLFVVTVTLPLGQGNDGIAVAGATVNGEEYSVSLGKSLRIEADAALIPAGSVTASNEASLKGLNAFQLPGVDPRAALVVRTDAAFRAAKEGSGEYLLLIGPVPLPATICKFVDLGSPVAPAVCK